MTAFDAERILAELEPFQRATVGHVMDRLYDPQGSRRFLVADETGLGKSVVAKGVIARTIERLQDDDDVDRIDIVYVCSNADIATQNIARLNVTGEKHVGFASRLTLLAKTSHQLGRPTDGLRKGVNLVSFTPGTSFDMGWQSGKGEERALLHLLLRETYGLRGARENALLAILQGEVTSPERFRDNYVKRLEREMRDTGPDPTVADAFRRAIRHDIGPEIVGFVDELGRRRNLRTQDEKDRARALASELRRRLAKVSVDTLTPDLVILDEFQRFRHLLDKKEGGEAADLAHDLFEYPDARVLLLSATPYKSFTYAEEAGLGDDHYEDFKLVLGFLADHDEARLAGVTDTLAEYRRLAVSGRPVGQTRATVREGLLRYLSRVERPQLGDDDMLAERNEVAAVTATDLASYVALRRLAELLDTHLPLDYWKSAPYFVNFLEGYQMEGRLKDALKAGSTAALRRTVGATQHLDRDAVAAFQHVDLGNSRLRALAAETVDRGWWQLLWMPPSLPYHQPGGPFADLELQTMTKRLVFSSWAATPTAIASLLSYEADRRIAEGTRLTENTREGRERITARLQYRPVGGRASEMTSLMLFWPNPALAQACDPLALAQRDPGVLASPEDLVDSLASALSDGRRQTPGEAVGRSRTAPETWYWLEAIGWGGEPPAGLADASPEELGWVLRGKAGRDDDTADPDEDEGELGGPELHAEQALDAFAPMASLPPAPHDLDETLALVGLHAPGNVAWRALGRVLASDHEVTPVGHWTAAATLASGFRALFNRPDAIVLIDRLRGDEEVYWRAVLGYCEWGNLQAVIDEYVQHLAQGRAAGIQDDEDLLTLAHQARDAVVLRPATYQAFDPSYPSRNIRFPSRFALRYGSARRTDEDVRNPEVQGAFNSPFWPFVLATTSVGQEGIDFHWWCHAVQHWNTPPNPVDFEQREGRVHRYGGLAIRRNIAAAHREQILARGGRNVWDTAYEVAKEHSGGLGELAPHWIYPGPSKVQRITSCLPLSSDHTKLADLKDNLALYRLTLGQPRQEDMLELLKRRGVTAHELADELKIDLRP